MTTHLADTTGIDDYRTRSLSQRLRHGVACALMVFAASLAVGTGPAMANTKGEHCIHPDGRDLNQAYGVTATIVAPFCAQVRTGEHWTRPAVWIVNHNFAEVPAGFTSPHATPLEDFRAKLVSVRYVIDAGTRQERTYVFPNSPALWTGTLALPPFGDLPAANTITLGTLHPLSTGQHTIDTYWRFSAQHCDGLGAIPEENCFAAGDAFYGRVTFDVMPASK